MLDYARLSADYASQHRTAGNRRSHMIGIPLIRIGRTTLVQCTLIAKRYSPYLRTYYERIKKMRLADAVQGRIFFNPAAPPS